MPEQQYSKIERQLRETEGAYASILEENEGLNKRIDELETQVAASNLPLDLIKRAVIYAFAPNNRKRVGTSEFDFDQWQRGITRYATEPLKKEIETLRQEAGALRGALFSSGISGIVNSNLAYKKIGFVYYDFANGKTNYTPALLELFEINEEESGEKKLSLKSFISYLTGENRAEIFDALRKGKSLENYTTKTRGGGKNLVLNAFPVVYDTSPVGVGVFLYDPAAEFDRRNVFRFAVKIRRAMRNISDEFEVIGKYSKRKNIKKPMDLQLDELEISDTFLESEIRTEDFVKE